MTDNKGYRLRKIRRNLGLTQIDFGEKLGLKKSYISNLENNQKPISRNVYEKLEEVFKANPQYIKTGEGKMYIIQENNNNNGTIHQTVTNTDLLKEIANLKKEIALKDQIIKDKERLIQMYEYKISNRNG